jgi:hypothetical protein
MSGEREDNEETTGEEPEQQQAAPPSPLPPLPPMPPMPPMPAAPVYEPVYMDEERSHGVGGDVLSDEMERFLYSLRELSVWIRRDRAVLARLKEPTRIPLSGPWRRYPTFLEDLRQRFEHLPEQDQAGAFPWLSDLMDDVFEFLRILEASLRQSSAPAQELIDGWLLASQLQAMGRAWPRPGVPPVVLYLDDERHYTEVRLALESALDAFGLEIVGGSPAIRGSVWQVLTTVLKRQANEERIDDAVGKGRAGLEARWYGEPQSQITKAQGEAISTILTALKDTENALLTFSNMLVLKVDGVPLVRELTPQQVAHLQENPNLYRDPHAVLQVLHIGLASVEPGHRSAGGEDAIPSGGQPD